ncbi:hypothetical protein NQ314_021208 [Rhamnusium bicolor]|uniref:Protein fuzzy n=1 Tax=Rhamnusium bicolor TaxID=1586634 RepID=A0AAV8WJP2_9CUCU|nr:hypothetical protein NQ314_021208 [Rhamnusium bicolor]
MSAHVICITSGGGLPIYSRKKGNSDNLPFSIIGSLNGVHMFGRPFNIDVLNSLTDDYSVAWKQFADSVVIIGIASGCSLEVLNKLLESAFNAVVLIVGIDEIKTQRNIERLKRELRICYPLVDRLLDSLDCGDSSNKHSSDLAGFVETILCPENHLIQIVLDSFTECVDSMFSCVLISGKIAAATESWWSLHPDEIRLLSLLAALENTANSKDIPSFYHTKAHRLLLVNTASGKYMISKHPQQNSSKKSTSSSHRLDILRSFFYRAVMNYLIPTTYGKIKPDNFNPLGENSTLKDKLSSDDFNVGTETYWCSEYHKCHAARVNETSCVFCTVLLYPPML